MMQVQDYRLEELKPYEKNPRNNDKAVQYVAESIRNFGFKVPIIIDKDNVIVCGHTRYKAAKQLNLETVPCIMADDLTDEQIKAFRLADNKTGEMAEWDFEFLAQELESLKAEDFDMQGFGFYEADEEYLTDFFDKTESEQKQKDNADEEEDEDEEDEEYAEITLVIKFENAEQREKYVEMCEEDGLEYEVNG